MMDRTGNGDLPERAGVGGDGIDPVFKRLQKVYDDIASEPLPNELLDLLAKLDEAERNR